VISSAVAVRIAGVEVIALAVGANVLAVAANALAVAGVGAKRSQLGW
jgi:hypothetical protein